MYRGKLVSLRPFTEAESARYLEWLNTAEAASQLGRALPVTPMEHRAWYEGLVGRHDAVVFAVYPEEDSRYIGNVWLWDIHPIHRSAELRIFLGDPEARGRGYGTDACRVLLDFSFRRLNLHKVYVYVLASNPRARRTFEKAGFREEGLLRDEFYVDGSYRDVLRMSALATDPWPPPALAASEDGQEPSPNPGT
jgi:RimJ/RimL family protein N-acetyltransferase